MNRAGRFLSIGVGGLLGLMLLGMIMSEVMDVSPNEIREVNLIHDWFWYRLTFYAVAVLCWTRIARFMTRPSHSQAAHSVEDEIKFQQRREKDFLLVKAQRWKLILMFAFFEVVVIQQFGIGS